jgi:hypothetical protein
MIVYLFFSFYEQHGSSIFGIFIRKLVLAFQQLMFDGVSRLFNEIIQFVKREDREVPTQDELNIFKFTNPISAEKYIYNMVQKLECKLSNIT